MIQLFPAGFRSPRRWRRILLFAIPGVALVAVVGMLVAPFVDQWFGDSRMKVAVYEYGFEPMVPPSTANEPGSMYLVDAFGRIKATVCSAPDNSAKAQIAEAEEVVIASLTNSSTSAKAKVNNALKTMGKGNSVIEVFFTLENVRIKSFDLAAVADINIKMQMQPLCQKQVIKLVKEGRCVTQSHSVLLASSGFKYDVRAGASLTAAQRSVLDGVLLDAAAKLGFHKRELRFGSNLYYGYRLADRCTTTPDATMARYVPSKRYWYFAAMRNLWSWTVESVQRTWRDLT